MSYLFSDSDFPEEGCFHTGGLPLPIHVTDFLLKTGSRRGKIIHGGNNIVCQKELISWEIYF